MNANGTKITVELPDSNTTVFKSGESYCKLVVVENAVPGEFTCRIDSLFVDPQHRRQGLGRKLLQAAIAEAKTYGFPIIIAVRPQDDSISAEALRAFFESEGFSYWKTSNRLPILLIEAD